MHSVAPLVLAYVVPGSRNRVAKCPHCGGAHAHQRLGLQAARCQMRSPELPAPDYRIVAAEGPTPAPLLRQLRAARRPPNGSFVVPRSIIAAVSAELWELR